MTQLPFVIQTIRSVDYKDFDNFVSHIYGHKFQIVSDQGLSNDSESKFIGRKQELSLYEQKCLDEFVKVGCGDYLAHIIFTDLVNRDLIPEGLYLVEVFW